MSTRDKELLKQAVELSLLSPNLESYRVGAILVDTDGAEISRAYTLELGPKIHAEEACLIKATDKNAKLKGATLYTSLEPCSVRLSGLRSCSSRIIESGITKVVYALNEPEIFVKCEGERVLKEAGISVFKIAELEERVREINLHLIEK